MKLPFLLLPALLLAVAAPAQHRPALDLSALAGPAAARPLPPPPAGASAFGYQPTPALREQTVLAEAARLQADDPTAATSLRLSFAPGKNDYTRLYAHMREGSGFADNDAAGALGLYLVTAYRATHGILDDQLITPAQERAVQAQVAAALARQPTLHRPAAVARLGETLKLRSVQLALDWARASQEPTEAAFRQRLTRQVQGAYGLDLARLRLTAQGFARL